MTEPVSASTLLIANSSGTVVSEVSVAAEVVSTVAADVAAVSGLAAISRFQWYFIGGSLAVIAGMIALECYDDEKALNAKRHWLAAAAYMGLDDHGSAIQELNNWQGASLPPEVWNAKDRADFDMYFRSFKNELAALKNAFDINAAEIERVRGILVDAVNSLVSAIIPILVIVIGSIALQAFFPTTAIAASIGIGATITVIGILAFSIPDLINAISTVTTSVTNNSLSHGFKKDSPAGNKNPDAPDTGLKDIEITWTKHDDAYYKAK
ncbi:hypothetical protein R8Z50_06730 [Longispora sp. K20-0274]|uniref:hypothetical protein n=1 Tax=Longispora sp. K20-0274 TaxID=3088255 RepID=UPI00399A64B6